MIQRETQSDTSFRGVSIVKHCMCNLREKVHGAVLVGVYCQCKDCTQRPEFLRVLESGGILRPIPQYYMSCWPQ